MSTTTAPEPDQAPAPAPAHSADPTFALLADEFTGAEARTVEATVRRRGDGPLAERFFATRGEEGECVDNTRKSLQTQKKIAAAAVGEVRLTPDHGERPDRLFVALFNDVYGL